MASRKAALVTGAATGIGAAAVRALARAGYDVAVNYSSSEKAARETAAEAEKLGAKTLLVRCDVSDEKAVRAMLESVKKTFGRLDVLVNNAGITIDRTVAKMTDDDWQNVLAVNLSGAFFTAQAALQHMIERGSGRIVNISSIIGEQGNIGQANYAASKSGLFGLTKTLAREAAFQLQRAGMLDAFGPNVTVNCVAPGFIATEMVRQMPEHILKSMVERTPVRRMGEPRDVANAYLFLASDEASFINGAVLSVDGGVVVGT